MLVTINTDASFCPNSNYGAYAFWVVCNEFKITKSGVFKSKCKNPQDAEARCVINALKVVLSAHTGITKIVVNTDSRDVVAFLGGDKEHFKTAKSKAKLKHIQEAYREVLSRSLSRAKIEFRHVKAHSGVKDKRSWVNEWCDLEAKRQLNRYRSLTKQTND